MAKVLSGLLLGMVVLCVVCCTTDRYAVADPKSDEEKPTRVALVDMAKVFKNSKAFENKRDALKQEIAVTEEKAKLMQAEVVQLKKALNGLEKGSEERNQLEDQAQAKAAEFERFRKAEAKRFLKAESEIYLEIYELATSEVAKYANDHGIDLVLRFSSEPVNEEDPQKLLQSLNRQVVYENKLDITDEIISAMK